MKVMYWIDEDRKIHSQEVSDEAIPFGIHARCWPCCPEPDECTRRIDLIDYEAMTFRCAPSRPGNVSDDQPREHGIPEVICYPSEDGHRLIEARTRSGR